MIAKKANRDSMKTRHKDSRDGRPAARKPAQAALPQERIVFGLHAAEAALWNPKRDIRHAYATENAALKLGSLIAARKIPMTALHPHEFDALAGADTVHQGVVLRRPSRSLSPAWTNSWMPSPTTRPPRCHARPGYRPA